MRVTKGDIVIDCANQAELRAALLALRSPQSDVPPLPGVHIPGEQYGPLDCALGVAELGEYIPEEEEQRLRLVPEVDTSGVQHVPVSRKCLYVLEAVMLFPEGVYVNGICDLLGVTQSQASGRLHSLKARGLVEHPPSNRNIWRATNLARRSKLVAC